MANVVDLQSDNEELKRSLTRLFQSGNINFLIGSGASTPAIPIAGKVECEINELLERKDLNSANLKIYRFMKEIEQANMPLILSDIESVSCKTTLNRYKDFVSVVERILVERKNSLLPKQANIFTTNYDLFFEKVCESFQTIILNDGFLRTSHLRNEHRFSTQNFFNSTYNRGHLYNYEVEMPSINLVKMHGSLSWKRMGEEIVFGVGESEAVDENDPDAVHDFNRRYAVVLPQKDKFRETTLNRTYYDLLRLYANQLDKENTLLAVTGFSFADEHIRDITLRAAKNPTLKILLFPYDDAARRYFVEMFSGYSNVDIVHDRSSLVGFERVSEILKSLFLSEKQGFDHDQ